MNLEQIKIENMHGVNRTYDLKKLNYFVGPNGAGKSTILQAIQLALLGYIPGYPKTKTAIFQHSSEPHMSVTLKLSDGDNMICLKRSWDLKGKDVVVSAELPDGFEVEKFMGGLDLPIFNFADFIGLSANMLKDWFISFLPATATAIDWDKELRTPIEGFGKILDPSYVDHTIELAKSTASNSVEGIRKLNTMLKTSLSEKKAEHTRIQNTVNSLIHYDDCDSSLNEDALRAEMDAKNARLYSISGEIYKANEQLVLSQKLQMSEAAAPADSLIEDRRFACVEADLNAANELLKKLEADIQECRSQIDTLQPAINYNNQVLKGGGICTYTKKQCSSISTMLDEITAENAKMLKQLEHLQAHMKELIDSQRAALESKASCEQDIRNLQAAYANKATNAAALRASGDKLYDATELTKEADTLRSEVKVLSNQITQVVANKQYEALQGKMTADMYTTQQIIEMLKCWIKVTDVNGLQSIMMTSPFFELSHYMTEDIRALFGSNDYAANFNLSEKANSFNFGISKADGTYVPYSLLSSGEKCLFVFALFSSLLRSTQAPLSMILVDDLLDHLDDTRIQSLFEYLRNNDTLQVIIAGVKPCDRKDAAEFVVEV